MDEKKTKGQLLEDKLLYNKESSYKDYAGKVKDKLPGYVDGYIDFMDAAKTEREFAKQAAARLVKAGFAEFDHNKKYAAGDKVYFNNRGRSLIAAVIGSRPLEDGTRIIAAHIDSPRLDLKPNPLYEDSDLGYFKTHYYGGIKKYQWVALPLALHGTVVLKDGSSVDIVIGEDDKDPVFCITDILPHLAKNIQGSRTTFEVIKGEELNVLLGSEPVEDDKVKEPVKLNLMRILNEKYGITEADFNSAEIEVVPALKARYIGLDKSMVGAYGQDDRVCSYTALTAILETKAPAHTAVCILADKEETGSSGNTGLESDMLRSFLTTLCRNTGEAVETLYHNSQCLSADVGAAFDPNFADVLERRNAAFLNNGPVIMKYTGAGGKAQTNDASAEFMGTVRALMDGNDLPWQIGELGKVDEGGGGTVAKYIANLGIEVVDIGVPLLSMHAPFEVASCLDIYAAYEAFCAFYK